MIEPFSLQIHLKQREQRTSLCPPRADSGHHFPFLVSLFLLHFVLLGDFNFYYCILFSICVCVCARAHLVCLSVNIYAFACVWAYVNADKCAHLHVRLRAGIWNHTPLLFYLSLQGKTFQSNPDLTDMASLASCLSAIPVSVF